MEKLLVRYTHYLRQNNIEVAPSSLIDMIELLPYINLKDKEEFYCSLEQLWVQNEEERERFSLCFKEFFYKRISEEIREIELESLKQEFQKASHQLEAEFKLVKSEKEDRWKEFLKKASERFDQGTNKAHRKIHKFIQAQHDNEKMDTNRIVDLLSHQRERDIEGYVENLLWQAIEQSEPSVVFDAIASVERKLIKSEHKNEVLKIKERQLNFLNLQEKEEHSGMRQMVKTSADELKERSFNGVGPEKIAEMREYIRLSTKSLFTKFSKLLKQPWYNDTVDMEKTIEKSAQTYGVPMEICYVKPKKNQTNIHVLLDVSCSGVKSAELLLMFIYMFYQHFPNQVRSFVFIGMLAEISSHLKNGDWEEVLEHCLKKELVDYRGYSDYGKALSIYYTNFGSDLNKDSIVFILGDARNNRHRAQENLLRNIKSTAKAVYWLNPESKDMWSQGDSVIRKYMSYTTNTYDISNMDKLLGSLEDIAQLNI